jgi:hypothetical protein
MPRKPKSEKPAEVLAPIDLTCPVFFGPAET